MIGSFVSGLVIVLDLISGLLKVALEVMICIHCGRVKVLAFDPLGFAQNCYHAVQLTCCEI